MYCLSEEFTDSKSGECALAFVAAGFSRAGLLSDATYCPSVQSYTSGCRTLLILPYAWTCLRSAPCYPPAMYANGKFRSATKPAVSGEDNPYSRWGGCALSPLPPLPPLVPGRVISHSPKGRNHRATPSTQPETPQWTHPLVSHWKQSPRVEPARNFIPTPWTLGRVDPPAGFPSPRSSFWLGGDAPMPGSAVSLSRAIRTQQHTPGGNTAWTPKRRLRLEQASVSNPTAWARLRCPTTAITARRPPAR
jgi:hypothetical protein